MGRKAREPYFKDGLEGVDCGKCKQWRPLENYGKDGRRKSGYKNSCRKCEADYSSQYRNKNKEKTIEYGRNYYSDNKDKYMDIQRENRRNDKDKYNAYKQLRRARKNSLPDTLTAPEIKGVVERFNGGCALTGDINYELDHFIAISTGHGGTIIENMIPLSRSLNASKQHRNPFEWFNDNVERFSLDNERFEQVIEYLSELNEMTTEEYKRYVNECYNDDSQLRKAN